MNRTALSLSRISCALALMTGATWAQAELSSAVYSQAKEQIQASYKVDRDSCDTLAGNTKDICVQTVKGREKVALAHLQMQRTGTAKDSMKLAQARYEARYDVAKEKCDDLGGNPKDVCVKAAKADFDKAKADVKMKKEVREAMTEADETKMKADYKVASERCESQTGQGKDACVASVKARYGM
jgi:hypothetical protein